MDTELKPEVVVLTDAVQLASQPGKLPRALITLKHRFPGALLWAPGVGGPITLQPSHEWVWIWLTLLVVARPPLTVFC